MRWSLSSSFFFIWLLNVMVSGDNVCEGFLFIRLQWWRVSEHHLECSREYVKKEGQGLIIKWSGRDTGREPSTDSQSSWVWRITRLPCFRWTFGMCNLAKENPWSQLWDSLFPVETKRNKKYEVVASVASVVASALLLSMPMGWWAFLDRRIRERYDPMRWNDHWFEQANWWDRGTGWLVGEPKRFDKKNLLYFYVGLVSSSYR